MDRRRLLKRLDKAWQDFQEAHAGLSDALLMKPGVTGAWSVRDIVAHVTTWEEEALKHLPLVLTFTNSLSITSKVCQKNNFAVRRAFAIDLA